MSHINNHEQLILSPEILTLLKLIMDHEQDLLVKLIRKAVTRHAASTTKSPAQGHDYQHHDHEQLRMVVSDFFMLLEALLQETKQEDETMQQLCRMRIPALTQINYSDHDAQALARSIAKAHNALDSGTEHAREVLCKELLKQWHPATAKKQELN